MEDKKNAENIGIIGLGQMGSGISVNLLRAGYNVIGYDLKSEAIENLISAGGCPAEDYDHILTSCEIVLTCVEARDSIRLADEILIPKARQGQIFIDHSTIPVPQARRIGKAFEQKGAKYLDAPISGGKEGAQKGTLRVFVGGDKETAERCWKLFEAIGNKEKIIYCGQTGMGQVVKVVQQLKDRFPNVARLEVMAFGIRSGLDLELLMKALDIQIDSEDPYAKLCKGIKDGSIEKFSFEFAEWEYYLEQVKDAGFKMPMLEAMYDFCKDAQKVTVDPLNRPEPSIWNELINYKAEKKM